MFEYKTMKSYDKVIKLHDDKRVACLSKHEFEKVKKQYTIIGETCYNNKKEEIGRVLINEEEYIISELGSHKGLLHKTVKYIKVSENQVVALVESNLAAILLPLALIAGAALIIGLIAMGRQAFAENPDEDFLTPDDNAEYVGTLGYSLGGAVVDSNGNALVGAEVTLFDGSQNLAAMSSNDSGSFMYRNVPDGYYMIVVKYEDKTVTKLVKVESADQLIQIIIDVESGSSEVVIEEENTPDYAVGETDKEASDTKKDVVINVRRKDDMSDAFKGALPSSITDLTNRVYEITATVDGKSVNTTENVMKVVVPFTNHLMNKFVVARYSAGGLTYFTEVSAEPAEYVDGTYMIDGNKLVIYTKHFGEFITAEEEASGAARVETTVGFNEYVDIDLATGKVDFYFYHSGESGIKAVLDFIVMQGDEEHLLATTGTIGNNYEIRSMTLDAAALGRLSAGNYSGLIRARYQTTSGSSIDTNIEMPVVIRVK